MLTRIEINGFKNLLGFSADFGPFTCIAGPNAVGKSNLFDAIEFLSLLTRFPLEEAASRVRQTSGSVESARRLFWNNGSSWAESITIIAEMIVPHRVEDGLGQWAHPESVCLRYGLVLRYDKGLRLVGEWLETGSRFVNKFIRFPHSSDFARVYGERYSHDDLRRKGGLFTLGAGMRIGGPATANFDLANASQTFLSAYATADHPLVLAANREMASWRRLNMDPATLRTPDPAGRYQPMGNRGEHLPGLMRRLTDPTNHSDPEVSYDDEELSATLVAWLRPVVSLRKIWVHEDPHSGVMTIRATLRDGGEISARDFSEGTLRYLALAVLALAPGNAVFTIEEPENGLHPDRFAELLELLREMSTDPLSPHAEPLPLRQVIVNSHSPALVREVYRHNPEDLLMASGPLTGGPDQTPTHILRLAPMVGTWRCSEDERGVTLPVVSYVGRAVRPRADASAAEDG